MKKSVLSSVACLVLVFGSFTFARDQSVCDTKYPETQYDARIDYCVCPTVEQKTWNKYTYCGFANGAIRIDNIYNYEPRGPKITSNATYGWAVKKKKSIQKKPKAITNSAFETQTSSSRNDPDTVTNVLYLCKNGERTLIDSDRMSDIEKQSIANKSTKHDPDINYSEGDVVYYARSLGNPIYRSQNCNRESKSDIRYDIYQCVSDTTWTKVSSGITTPKGVKYNSSGPSYGLNDLVYVLSNESKPSSIDCSVFDVYQCTTNGRNQTSFTSKNLEQGVSVYYDLASYIVGDKVYRPGPSMYPRNNQCSSVVTISELVNITTEYKGNNVYWIKRTPMRGNAYIDVYIRKSKGGADELYKMIGSTHGSQGLFSIDLPTDEEYTVILGVVEKSGGVGITSSKTYIGPSTLY